MRESLLVFGAFTILSVCGLSINGIIVRSTEQVIDNEVYHVATALAQTMMNEIASLSFDEKTVGGKYVNKLSDLTPVASLGSDNLETTKFDDVDDYHNKTLPGDSARYPGFTLSIQVVYADTLNPLNKATAPTLLKRVTVTVKNPIYLHDPDSLRITSFIGYY